MKNYGTSTMTEVDNYNIGTFLDFCIAKSLIIMPLKSNSRSIPDSMHIYIEFPRRHNTLTHCCLMLGQCRRWRGSIGSLALCNCDCRQLHYAESNSVSVSNRE